VVFKKNNQYGKLRIGHKKSKETIEKMWRDNNAV
jgi:hypothetical protein